MKNKFFFFLLVSLFLLSFVSAATVKQSTEYDIRHSVRVNGGIDSINYCNITVTNSNNTVIVNFLEMTDQTSYFNYTLNTSDTSLKGDYCYDITCAAAIGLNETDSWCFLVNPTGIEPSDQRSSTIIFAIIVLFVISLLIFIGGFKVTEFPPLRWSLFIIGAIFILIALNVLFVSIQDVVVNQNIENLFDTIIASSFYLYWFAGGLIFMIWFITIIANATSISRNRKAAKLKGIGTF